MSTSKQHLATIRPHVQLYRDADTGIAWIEDGTSGMGHSVHPNIDATGSVEGMIANGYWSANARPVTSHGWIYNTAAFVADDDLDQIVAPHCRCGGNHGDH